MGGPSSWEWMIYFGLPALLQATIISIGIYLGVRFGMKKILSKAGSLGSETGDAMEIVRSRYARGEISRKEYEQLRDDLEAGDLQARKERAR